ncbi:MAG: hypothetical protein JXR40_13150 [Pontiellaceae bacterium]|nr:hypothetical protein [Pontiellaceae bacterium]
MNLKQIIAKQSSEHLAYIAIAAVGFISSLATLFIDVNSKVSTKWLLLVVSLSLITIIFLVRVLVAIATAKGINNKIRILKVYKDKGVIVLRSPTDLAINSLLSLYEKNDSYEELIGMGYVQNKQEDGVLSVKIIQINDAGISDDFGRHGLVKTTLPYNLLASLESDNG